MVLIAVGAGLASGLLANAGGFLLAPLYLLILRLPIKQAFASSLAVACVLAVPGTIVHAALGHIDWAVVVAFGLASIPLSWMGAPRARCARIREAGERTERDRRDATVPLFVVARRRFALVHCARCRFALVRLVATSLRSEM